MGAFMKKETTRSPVIVTVLLIVLLVLFYHQESFSKRDDSWKANFGNWRPYLPSGPELMKLQLSRLVRGNETDEFETTGFSCSYNDFTEECVIMAKPIALDMKSLTIYLPSNDQSQPTKRTIIKPYPRRIDKSAMEQVSPVQIVQGNVNSINPPASCQYTHDVPAVVFSFGRFSANTFHEFNEIIIPLFITSRHFESRVQFVVADYRERWFKKYGRVFEALSQYGVLDADSDETVHCFPAAVVGLRYHDDFTVNTSEVPKGYTMESVRQFLWEAYNVDVKTKLNLQKPKLLLISRRGSRTFLNEDAMVKMMEQELGLEVHIARPNETSNLAQFAQIVNSCEIMVGAHGAGLTNAMFLPTGAMLIQIVPLGLNWASDHYFGDPAPGIGLRYIRYKVWSNESSLYEIYGPDDPIVSDPGAIWARGYAAVKEAYIDKQNFRINLERFKGTLLEALNQLGQSYL